MPAPKDRGGARGGGIVGGGRFEVLSQGGTERQEEDDVFMRDNGHPEKRKRKDKHGRAKDSPQGRPTSHDHDSDSASAEATPRKKTSPMTTRTMTRSAEKEGTATSRETAIRVEGSPTPGGDGNDSPRGITMNDIMKHLLDTQRRAQEREEQYQKRAQEKEEQYREEIRQLQTTITTLAVPRHNLLSSQTFRQIQ